MSRLRQQSLNVLRRPLILLMIELVDGPVEQLAVEVAVVDGGAVYPVGVQLAIALQIASDAIVIELATGGKTGKRQQLGRQPLALFAPVLLLADLLGVGTADGAVVIGTKGTGMDRHHLLVGILQLAPEGHFRLNLHLLVTADRRFRQKDRLVAQREYPELTRMARHEEGEQRLGRRGIAHHDRYEVRRFTRLLQMTGEIARDPESDKLALCCYLHLAHLHLAHAR